MVAELRHAIESSADDLFALLAALVRERSLLGSEEGAQRILEHRLRGLGFETERVQPDANEALRDPAAGYPPLSYEGRTCVAGRLPGTGGGRSLHLSGHVDVVPVDAEERWTHDPWAAEIADGRMWGRGAGDMKAGLAAYLVGVEALLEVAGRPRGELLFSSVIEEECGGNGMHAVVRAGYAADATLIGEPTDLRLHANGVGVVWATLTARGRGAHAAIASETRQPVDQIFLAVQALRALEATLNEGQDGHPYNLNLGEIHGGVWPSSVPAEVTLRARLGFGPEHEPAEVQGLMRDALGRAAPEILVEFDGFRCPAYEHDVDGPFPRLVAAVHRDLHGDLPGVKRSTATTDARYVDGPCLCYGPIAGASHGIDEWVDLRSTIDTAVAVALVASRWCG